MAQQPAYFSARTSGTGICQGQNYLLLNSCIYTQMVGLFVTRLEWTWIQLQSAIEGLLFLKYSPKIKISHRSLIFIYLSRVSV